MALQLLGRIKCNDLIFQSFKYVFLSHIPFRNLWIISIRSPGPVTPRDVECEGFDLTYTRIASDKMASPSPHSNLENDVDKKVDDAISSFLLSLSQIGPELLSVSTMKSFSLRVLTFPSLMFTSFPLQGGLTLSFFERRATRQLFGLVSNEERVV